MPPPNFGNLTVRYPGFIGSVGNLYQLIRGQAADYEYKGKNWGPKDRPKYDARAASLRATAERIKSADSLEAVNAILVEKNFKFNDNHIIDNVNTLGGKLRKGKSRKGKSRKGKSRKGKSRKGKTRRR
jgi:hypothetical protein